MTTLSGSAAALLGALYALGAAVEWRRLTLADVRVADGLPLVPLPHLLTAGISVLLSTVVAFIGVTLFLLGLHAVDQLVKSRRINRHLARILHVGVWCECLVMVRGKSGLVFLLGSGSWVSWWD